MITVVEKKSQWRHWKKNTISQINLISLHVNRFWHIQQTKDTYVHGDWKSFQPQVYQNQSKLVTHTLIPMQKLRTLKYINKIQIQI